MGKAVLLMIFLLCFLTSGRFLSFFSCLTEKLFFLCFTVKVYDWGLIVFSLQLVSWAFNLCFRLLYIFSCVVRLPGILPMVMLYLPSFFYHSDKPEIYLNNQDDLLTC